MATYTVDADLEWMAKVALRAVAIGYARLTTVIPAGRIVKAMDASADRNIESGGIAIDALFDKTIPGNVVEYHAVLEWKCIVHKSDDASGQLIGTMVGLIRDMLNTDDVDGSGNDFLTALNAQGQVGDNEIVFHDVREGNTVDESDDEYIVRAVQADGWAYPGRATA